MKCPRCGSTDIFDCIDCGVNSCMKCSYIWNDENNSKTLAYYIKECGEDAKKHGWHVTWDSYPEYILAAIDELMDSFEKGWRKDNKEKAFEEIGDCFVRLFHYCYDLNIPIEDILKRLMANNKRRAYKHGNKRI